MPFIEKAAEHGKPIAFHIGADFYETTHPYRLSRIAARLPETQFLMVHIGGAGTPLLERSAVETAAAHLNITFIGNAIDERAVLVAIHTLP